MSSVGGGPITQCECPQCNKRAIITIMTNHATPIPDQFVCLTGMKHSSTAAYCLSNPTGLTAAIGGRSKCHAKEHSETHRRNPRRKGTGGAYRVRRLLIYCEPSYCGCVVRNLASAGTTERATTQYPHTNSVTSGQAVVL